jgi:hypothetical protein
MDLTTNLRIKIPDVGIALLQYEFEVQAAERNSTTSSLVMHYILSKDIMSNRDPNFASFGSHFGRIWEWSSE